MKEKELRGRRRLVRREVGYKTIPLVCLKRLIGEGKKNGRKRAKEGYTWIEKRGKKEESKDGMKEEMKIKPNERETEERKTWEE